MRYWRDDTGAIWTTTTDAGNILAERDGKWQEVTVTPVDGLRPDADVIERAARLLHALQWMGDQEDADAAWDRYPITSATRSDYLRTAEALAAAGLFAPIDETRVWVCGVCGHSPEAHGMPQHSSHQCMYQPILTPSDTFASTKPSDAERPYCPVHGDLLAGVRSERCRTAHAGHEPDAEHLLSVVETIKETGGSVQIRGVLITPCDTYGQPLTSVRPDADVDLLRRAAA